MVDFRSSLQQLCKPLLSLLKLTCINSDVGFCFIVASFMQIVAYSGWETIGQTFYLDSFDQLGASQYTLL